MPSEVVAHRTFRNNVLDVTRHIWPIHGTSGHGFAFLRAKMAFKDELEDVYSLIDDGIMSLCTSVHNEHIHYVHIHYVHLVRKLLVVLHAVRWIIVRLEPIS